MDKRIFLNSERGVGGPVGHKLRRTVAPKENSLLMGFYGISSSYVRDTKNDCSCKPTHDQVQPETRHGVSGSHREAQRQDLLCSRSQLSRPFNHGLQTEQTAQLWGCLLGRDKRRRHSLRLDRGPQRNSPVHQVGAQDDASTRIFKMDQLGNLRVGQGRRPAVRCRTQHRHRSRNVKSCPRIGQLFSDQVNSDLGKSPNLKSHKLTSNKRAGGPTRHKLRLIVAETIFHLTPTFSDARVGGPVRHKVADRGPWIKNRGTGTGGLD